MPQYDFQCVTCGDVQEKILKYSEYDAYKASKPACEVCGKGHLERAILTAPAMDLPAHMSHDGKSKFLGSRQIEYKGEKQSRIPINIIDENPDGSCTVTRIGQKKDLDNE